MTICTTDNQQKLNTFTIYFIGSDFWSFVFIIQNVESDKSIDCEETLISPSLVLYINGPHSHTPRSPLGFRVIIRYEVAYVNMWIFRDINRKNRIAWKTRWKWHLWNLNVAMRYGINFRISCVQYADIKRYGMHAWSTISIYDSHLKAFIDKFFFSRFFFHPLIFCTTINMTDALSLFTIHIYWNYMFIHAWFFFHFTILISRMIFHAGNKMKFISLYAPFKYICIFMRK